MLRCTSAGTFSVTLMHNEEGEHVQEIGAHGPVYKMVEVAGVEVNTGEVLEPQLTLTSATPYTGELCEHELMFLRNPSKYVNPALFFLITEVK